MSSPTLLTDPELTGGIAAGGDAVPGAPERLPSHVARRVLSGTSALGLGTVVERGLGFLANVLAARLGGKYVFGEYSLAISTANNISTYAAGQIGSTAARFSGKYPYGKAGYTTLARALVIVSTVSAAVAFGALWAGAGPIAHLLGKDALTTLLRWASISAIGMMLLECTRGFFVGQHRLKGVVLLSTVVGVGMVALLPWTAARHQPIAMIVAQGVVTLTAVTVCLLLATPLRLLAPAGAPRALPLGPVLREVWAFGFVQLSGLLAANLAGWWVTAMVARSDASLAQMGFFAIASQMRNLASLVPSLVTEGSYATMADPEGEGAQTPQRVMALGAFASIVVSLGIASVGMVAVPWALRWVYGRSYEAAAVTVAAGLMTAVLHMGNAPAAARLTILSIRSTAVNNTLWAAFVATVGTLLMFHGGNAAEAMEVFGAAHLLTAGVVLLLLHRRRQLPRGMVGLYLLSSAAVVTLLGLATERARLHGVHEGALTGAMLVTVVATGGALAVMGRRYRWLPSSLNPGEVLRKLRRRPAAAAPVGRA